MSSSGPVLRLEVSIRKPEERPRKARLTLRRRTTPKEMMLLFASAILLVAVTASAATTMQEWTLGWDNFGETLLTSSTLGDLSFAAPVHGIS